LEKLKIEINKERLKIKKGRNLNINLTDKWIKELIIFYYEKYY